MFFSSFSRQRLLNSHNGKPRSVSNNTKKSIDKNSGMEKDYMGREKLESKSVKRISNMGNQRERESYSSPPLEKTPEKAKTQLKKKKSVVEYDLNINKVNFLLVMRK